MQPDYYTVFDQYGAVADCASLKHAMDYVEEFLRGGDWSIYFQGEVIATGRVDHSEKHRKENNRVAKSIYRLQSGDTKRSRSRKEVKPVNAGQTTGKVIPFKRDA